MNYEALNYTNYDLVGLAFCTTIPISLLILAVFLYKRSADKKGLTGEQDRTIDVFGGGVFVAIILGAIIGGIVGSVAEGAQDSNEKVAAQNIMKKYDVKEVDWDSQQTRASATQSFKDEGNELVLTANNGKNYVFIYDLNKETSEPTLKDMPIAGGTDSGNILSAEDLLK